MAGSSIKIGVDVTEFKRGMTEAQASVKSLDAQLKVNEKSMQLYGKSESYVSTQAGILNQKLEEQRKIVQNAEKSLKTMEQNGVSRTSKAYQDMQRKMLEARGAMIDTEVALNQLTTGEAEAAKGAEQLANSVGGISKKMSLDQVISGINSITGAMESAAKKAVDLGKAIWENITGSAEWADNTATQAMILGMDVEEYQRYAKVFETVGEITVAEWRKAKLKVQKAINDPTQDQTDILALLGIETHATSAGKYGMVQGAARDFEEVFWEIGETLRAKVASGELTQDMADVYANAIFGKGFDQLNPLFNLGQEGFTAALKEQQTVTEESVQKLADLNDQLIKLEGDFNTLKTEVLASLAPALQEGAKALDSLLGKLIEYLQSEKGQEALQKLGDAVSGLFADMSKIDPEKVVQGFVDVFTKVIDGIQWLVDNKEAAKGVLGTIVAGWGALKLGNDVLKIIKLVDGIKGLMGAETAAQTAGQAIGSSWAAGFAKGLIAVAPWLAEILGVTGIALTPSILAQKANEEKWKSDQQRREEAAALGGEYSDVIAAGAAAVGPKKNADGSYKTDWTGLFLNMNPTDEAYNVLMGLSAYQNQQRAELFNIIRKYAPTTVTQNGAGYTIDELLKFWGGEEFDYASVDALLTSITDALAQHAENAVQVPAEIDIPDDTAQQLSQEIGTVKIHGEVVPGESVDGEQANGIWAVPYDGYLARLHKNERVMPAREVASRSYSSNLYVEHMIMNNGTDAEGLAAAMAAKQRQTMTGFGS